MKLDKLGAGEGLWLMAMAGLGAISGLLLGGKLDAASFVSAFLGWVTAVFSSAAVAGFRDWKKNGNGPPPPPNP